MNEKLTDEQLRAVETIDRNIVLAAGAGSGKTKVLVDRYFYILENGARRGGGELAPMDILAITFTNKAAAEMRARVRKKLLAKIEETADQEARGFWRRQLKGLELAQISTIHSLCSRILRENPLKSGLDPGFTVLEDFDNAQFEEQCLDGYLEREFAAGNEDLRLLLDTYGLDSVRGNLLQARQEMLKLPEGCDLAADYSRERALMRLRGGCESLKEALKELINESHRPDEKSGKSKKTKAHEKVWGIEEHLGEIEAGLDKLPPDLVLFDELASFKGNLPGSLKDAIKETQHRRSDIDLLLVDCAAEPYARAWQHLMSGYAERLSAQRLEPSALGFDDLERLAVELLERDRDVCRRYQEAFSYIMVDEFQDTNDRQRRLVYLLAGGDAEALKDNRLFVVGDPQQSIYRFRGADVSVFARVQADVGEEGCLKLSVNFRSTESILEAANTVCSRLMDQPGTFSRLEPSEANRGRGAKPELLEVRYKNEDQATAGENRGLRLEFEAVAGKMEQIFREDAVPYEDMTVLLSAMTHCDLLTDALRRHGIPYRVVDGKGFYERQEVLDLLNLFKAVRNRRRSLELAGVLRSPYFGLSDATLTALFIECQGSKRQTAQKCLWDELELLSREIRGGASDLAEKLRLDGREKELVARAAATLAELRSYGSVCSLAEFMRKVWSALHVELILKLQDEGETKLANARKLRRLAEEYAAQKDAGLSSWLEHLDAMERAARQDRSMVAETAANTAGGGVEIMTIHKAKGLERRVIFVPMLDRSVKPDRDELKLRFCSLPDQPEPAWHLGIKAPLADGSLKETSVFAPLADGSLKETSVFAPLADGSLKETSVFAQLADGSLKETSVFAQLKDRDKKLEDDEGHRKLYVAMTRAREALVLSGSVCEKKNEKKDKKDWLARIEDVREDTISISQLDGTELQSDAAQPDGKREARAAEDVLSPEELALAEPLAAYTGYASREFSPSELEHYLYCQRRYFYEHVRRYPELRPAEKSGGVLPANVIGSVIHKALELYHWQLDDEARTYAVGVFEQALRKVAPGADAQAARELFLSYTASGLYTRTQDDRRELEFTLPLNPSLTFKGVIDCLRQEGDAARIVDYKTGSLKGDSSSLKGYELQLAIYKAAAERMFPGKKVSAALHFLKGPVVWELPDKGEALKEAVELCNEIGAKKEEEQFARCSESEEASACKRCPYSYVCRRRRD